MKFPKLRASALAIAMCGGAAFAQTAVYPARGQSPAKQQKDEAECSVWAQKKTGVDPAALAAAGQAQPNGQVARGAGRGAAAGAVGGAITGRPGRGAAIGSSMGAAAGAGRKRGAEKQQQEQSQVALSEYNNARAACLTGKGYTVR